MAWRTWLTAKGISSNRSTASAARLAQVARVASLPAGSTRSTPASARTTGHASCGAPGRCQVSARAAQNSAPARRPKRRAAASADTSPKKKSHRFHAASHSPSLRSTPLACSRRQPGGRCRTADTLEKSACHAVAGSTRTRPSMRLSALTSAMPWRTSTPILPPSPPRVTGRSCPSTDTRPRTTGGSTSSRHDRDNSPPIRSCKV